MGDKTQLHLCCHQRRLACDTRSDRQQQPAARLQREEGEMLRDPILSGDGGRLMVKVMRGGGWWFPIGSCAARQRDLSRPRELGDNVGFRVVCGLSKKREELNEHS